MNSLLKAVGLGAVLASAVLPARAAAYGGLVIFGDSLSDTGNAGRYSNGPVWVEHVARALGAKVEASGRGGSNYAVGGARLQGPAGSHSLRAQADEFLRSRAGRLDPNTLYVVYGGGNDLRAAVGAPDMRGAVHGALLSLRSILDDLIAAGAREILVPNLPNLAHTPETRSRGPNAAAAATELTVAFNQGLEGVLREVETGHGIRIKRLDVYRLMEEAAANPASFGFANITEPCSWQARACSEPDKYLFWDSIHPTAAGHARLGEAALRAISASRS